MVSPQERKRPGEGARRRDRRKGSGRAQVRRCARDQVLTVGRNLRRIRRSHRLSLRDLASESGLAVNTLSRIENDRTSPSISTLQRVALALGVSIVDFFESEAPGVSVVHVRSGHGPRVPFHHGGFRDLGTGMMERRVVPLLVTLEPGSGTGLEPIAHSGHEFVYCLAGGITYGIRDQAYLLGPGDSLLFEARQPHSWENKGSTVAKALLVLCPTDEREVPAERHFGLMG